MRPYVTWTSCPPLFDSSSTRVQDCPAISSIQVSSTLILHTFLLPPHIQNVMTNITAALSNLCCTWRRHAEGSGNTAVCDFLCYCQDVCGSRDSHTKLACSFVLHLCFCPPCVSLKSVCVTCGLNNNVKPEQYLLLLLWIHRQQLFFIFLFFLQNEYFHFNTHQYWAFNKAVTLYRTFFFIVPQILSMFF